MPVDRRRHQSLVSPTLITSRPVSRPITPPTRRRHAPILAAEQFHGYKSSEESKPRKTKSSSREFRSRIAEEIVDVHRNYHSDRSTEDTRKIYDAEDATASEESVPLGTRSEEAKPRSTGSQDDQSFSMTKIRERARRMLEESFTQNAVNEEQQTSSKKVESQSNVPSKKGKKLTGGKQKSRKKSKGRSRRVSNPSGSPRIAQGCVNGTIGVTQQLSSCFAVASDIYGQECGDHHDRGDDNMFFMHPTNGDDDSDDGIDATLETTRRTDRTERSVSQSKSRNISTHTDVVAPEDELRISQGHAERTPSRNVNETTLSSYTVGEPPPIVKMSRCVADDQREINGNRDPDGPIVIPEVSPTQWLRRPRGAYEVQELGQPRDANDFRVGSPSTAPLPPLSSSQNNWRDSPQALRMELQETKILLEQATKELANAKKESSHGYQASAEVNEKIMRERLEAEQKLMREKREKEKLQQRVEALVNQVQVMSKSTRQEAASKSSQLHSPNESDRHKSPLRSSPSSIRSRQLQKESEDFASLKAEIAKTRTQMTQIRVSQTALEQEKERALSNARQASEDQKRAEGEIFSLQSRINSLQATLDRTKRSGTKDLERKLSMVQSTLDETQRQADERRQRAFALQEELTKSQVETDQLRSQVSRFMADIEETKRSAQERVECSEREAKKLEQQVHSMKSDLDRTNVDIIAQSASHLKERQSLRKELIQSRQAAQALQNRVVAMDDQIAAAENEAYSLQNRIEADRLANRGQNGTTPVLMEIWRRGKTPVL